MATEINRCVKYYGKETDAETDSDSDSINNAGDSPPSLPVQPQKVGISVHHPPPRHYRWSCYYCRYCCH